MKKLKAFLTLSICLCAMFMFVGCCGNEGPLQTLSTPTNTIVENKIVKFDVVQNALYYAININNVDYYAYLNQSQKIRTVDNRVEFDASDIMYRNITYTAKVKAGAKGYNESEYGNSAYFVNKTQLGKPSAEIVGNKITWDTIENADYYNVKIVLPADEENPEGGTQPNTVTYVVRDANSYDFGSLLTDAGTYKFYVSAASYSQYFSESETSEVKSYNHYLTLSAPENIKISKRNGIYYLRTIVDENTTSLRLAVDGVEAPQVSLDSKFVKIDEKFKNYVEVNLSLLFTTTNFNNNKDYEFKVQNRGGNFFVDSNTTTKIVHLNYATLSPITATYTASTRTIKWNATNEENAIGYNIYVVTYDGVEKIYREKDLLREYILPENFVTAYVQVVGNSASVKDSLFSNAVSKDSANLDDTTIYKAYIDEEGYIEPVTTGKFNCIAWTPIAGAHYIVEFGDEVKILGNTAYVYTEEWLENYNLFVLHAYKEGYAEITRTKMFSDKIELSSPTNVYVDPLTPTLIKFDASKQAIGYKLYVTSKIEAEAKWEEICEQYAEDRARQSAFNAYLQDYYIAKLFATTEIDAKPYIKSVGEYKMYIQAVADKNTVYSDSVLKYQDGISVSLFNTLETPTFYKSAQGILDPVSKVVVDDVAHYNLKFYGVVNATDYDIVIKYDVETEKTLSVEDDGRIDCYVVDITNYLTGGGVYSIKVRARNSNEGTLILPSRYAQCTYEYRVQLNKVTNLRVEDKVLYFTDTQERVYKYKITITKPGDATFGVKELRIVDTTCNLSGFIGSYTGKFNVSVTALAIEGDYYSDSDPATLEFYI